LRLLPKELQVRLPLRVLSWRPYLHPLARPDVVFIFVIIGVMFIIFVVITDAVVL
jgi:hypothetical protein